MNCQDILELYHIFLGNKVGLEAMNCPSLMYVAPSSSNKRLTSLGKFSMLPSIMNSSGVRIISLIRMFVALAT